MPAKPAKKPKVAKTGPRQFQPKVKGLQWQEHRALRATAKPPPMTTKRMLARPLELQTGLAEKPEEPGDALTEDGGHRGREAGSGVPTLGGHPPAPQGLAGRGNEEDHATGPSSA